MTNKMKLTTAMCELVTGTGVGFDNLAGLVIKTEWCVPESTDFPNYPFVYKLANEYCKYAQTIDKPLIEGMVYENAVRYLASLAKQDPAYYSRFNGIMFRVLHDYKNGKISRQNGENLNYFKSLVKWWDTFDGRERNHDLYLKFLNYIVDKYSNVEFYQFSIDFCLNWIGEHSREFVYSDDMNPKRWYGNNGVGFMDNLTMAGMG